MAGRIAYQISCELNGVQQKYLLDTIKENSVETSSTMTRHPIYQGDNIGDHMYRNQASVTISGSYGLNAGSNFNPGTDKNKLATFQAIFETIQKQGIICDLLKLSSDETGISFLKRNNMALTSISWTEKITSIDFDFTFTQIITTSAATNAQTYVDDLGSALGIFDETDKYLPTYFTFTPINFTTSVINYSNICKMINEEVATINSTTQGITNRIRMLGTNGLTSLGINQQIAKMILAAISMTSINIQDKLFGNGFVEHLNSQLILQSFNTEEDEIQNPMIVEYCNYLGSIYNKVKSLSEKISLYQPSSPGEQICTLLIDNVYYEFTFKKNNVSQQYYLSVKNAQADDSQYEMSSMMCSTAPTTFSDCLLENMLFKTSNSYIYLLKPKEINENNINEYYILVSTINPEVFNGELNDIIETLNV